VFFIVHYEYQLMSMPILFRVYDYDNDRCLGTFADYDEAEITCSEYQNNYGEPVEVLVEEVELSMPQVFSA
jgi:hypothetical protein